MTIKSIAHKVVQVEKRNLENERSSTFSTFVLFAFWTLVTTGALGVAALSFYTAKPRVELAGQEFGVDRITTAGVSAGSGAENTTGQRLNAQLANRNDRRINDVTRVINRLRDEQSSLNERLAELDLSIGKLRIENKDLKSEIASLSKKTTQPSGPVIIPAAPKTALSPEQVNAIVPRSVDTKRVTNGIEVTIDNPTVETAPENDNVSTSSFPKTTVSSLDDSIDGIKVGAIPIAQTSLFALDLGASSTAARAKTLWKELRAQQPDIISALTPKYVATGLEDGQTRLVAGPFDNASDAIKACVQIRKIESFCKTTLFPQ